MAEPDVLDRLMDQIHQRVREMPDDSYTTKLLRSGPKKTCAKILEEACEVTVEATASSVDKQRLIYESCDVIYHLWVLLGSQGITASQSREELQRREGTSGLEEKRSRKKSE